MCSATVLSPAEIAAEEAWNEVKNCLNNSTSFVLEAGAGAGKTYTLIQALRYLIDTKSDTLLRKHQRIACITYTNVGRDVIENRVDSHPCILPVTIHSFCWSLIKNFQPFLRQVLAGVGKWEQRLLELEDIGTREIKYDHGYPLIEEKNIYLDHDDIVPLMVTFLNEAKFRAIFKNQFPIILIDEYQDTDNEFVEALKNHFLTTSKGPLIGFFGDHWQKIYGSSACGKVEHDSLKSIGKRANFRSNSTIVNCLNRMRPGLTQKVNNPASVGTISVYHSNIWQGKRRTGAHWAGDLPVDDAHQYLNQVKELLTTNGWDFSSSKTKVLMLTHNLLATEQGYKNLADVFSRNEHYIKQEDAHIDFFCNTLESICLAYENNKYGEMFALLGSNGPIIKAHSDKESWVATMDQLLALRRVGNIGQVIDYIISSRIKLPDKIIEKETLLRQRSTNTNLSLNEKQILSLNRLEKLRTVSYTEVVALAQFIKEKTPFTTKHSVKGEEYENVLVVIGRGWSQYNFDSMLKWANSGIPSNKADAFERNRNLFYVACSRSKQNLALLFTQELSTEALQTLSNWFEVENIYSL